jgi:hypothetical protein
MKSVGAAQLLYATQPAGAVMRITGEARSEFLIVPQQAQPG